MTIKINKQEFLQLIGESTTFRSMVYDLFEKTGPQVNVLEFYGEELRKRFPHGGSFEKIPAIKWLRGEVKDEKHLDAFADAGFDVYIPVMGADRILGLAAAKRFVDTNCNA